MLLAALLAPAALAALVGLVMLWPSGRAPAAQAATAVPVHAQVVETHAARCDDASALPGGSAAPNGAGGGPQAAAGGAAGVGGDGSGCVNPLWLAVVGACLIMFVVLYLTHGPSARTSTAVLGTLVSLLLIGGLSAAFTALARLTGLDDTTSALIGALGTGVDARGLLLAGVVIGALGVLDDVTVTQTSAVWELHGANPALGARGLFTAAMRIGRDHVSSAVNTLVLAYAGASLPLMLIFSVSGRGLGDVVTTQEVATEIVRTLVGSIGLVASVPITTAVAAVVASREDA